MFGGMGGMGGAASGPPLSLACVQKIVGRVSYKPGWRIRAEEPTGDRSTNPHAVRLVFQLPTHDRDTLKPVRLAFEFRYDGFYTEHQVVYAVFESIRALEDHEARELFTYDGERLYDPHK